MVKVIIKRTVKVAQERDLQPLLLQLRALATAQPGYISGETLMNVNDPEDYLVISSWKSREDWDMWVDLEERTEVQSEIDTLLGCSTTYQVYFNG